MGYQSTGLRAVSARRLRRRLWEFERQFSRAAGRHNSANDFRRLSAAWQASSPNVAWDPRLEGAWTPILKAWSSLLQSSDKFPKGFGRFERGASARKEDGNSAGAEDAKEAGEPGKAQPEFAKAEKKDSDSGESGRGQGQGDNREGPKKSGRSSFEELLIVLAIILFMTMPSPLRDDTPRREISFHSFVWDLLAQGKVERIEVADKSIVRVYLKDDDLATDESADQSTTTPAGKQTLYFNIGSLESFERKLDEAQAELGLASADYVPVSYTTDSTFFSELLKLLPTVALVGVAFLMMRNSLGGGIPGAGGRNIFQVGKANPIIVKAGDVSAKKTSFSDVAGLDEAKREVMEFVDFLKAPTKYETLGAKIPKGALLVGPPGTGKTLLAKATAGEANVPFFSMSGSDFIEMFVGVGPSRVRDLFGQARQAAPCIVFIDEIDAVGRARGRGGFGGGNDERENTLNAILVEMDGFTASSGVVILAGTNRADILDKALLRPGRFDRQINIDKPDIRGRFQIFKVHLKSLTLADKDTDSVAKRLAATTPGFAGADIANICNEGALIAAREGKDAVELSDFEKATDRVIGGLEKKNKVISAEEKKIVAHHEAGHAVAGWFLRHADPLLKVSIIPRGSGALGFAQYLPQDRFLQSKEQLEDFMVMALAGRVAEELIFGSVTTGAQDDLMRVTRAAYAIITTYGMNERVGTVHFPADGSQGSQFYKPYSEDTAEIIDAEARELVDHAYDRCKELLTGKLDIMKSLANALLEKEVVRDDDLVKIMGDRPFAKIADYDTAVERFEDDRAQRTKAKSDKDSDEPEASPTGLTSSLAASRNH